MQSYQHDINEFNMSTFYLSVEEECMYHRSLSWYYANEKPLPKNRKQIYRYLRATTKKLRDAVDNVLNDFFIETEDGFHHAKCDEVIAEHQALKDKRSHAGKVSAERRKNTRANDAQVLNTTSTTDEQVFNISSTSDEQMLNTCSTPVNNSISLYNIDNIYSKDIKDNKDINKKEREINKEKEKTLTYLKNENEKNENK